MTSFMIMSTLVIPSPSAEITAKAICLIIDEAESWHFFRRFCIIRNYFEKLLSVDKDSFPFYKFQKLNKYFKIRDYNEDNCRKISIACIILYKW